MERYTELNRLKIWPMLCEGSAESKRVSKVTHVVKWTTDLKYHSFERYIKQFLSFSKKQGSYEHSVSMHSVSLFPFSLYIYSVCVLREVIALV